MKSSLLPVGELVAKLLCHSGVKHVFGFPGETSLPFYIGMQRTTSIQHILARCPRCAGYMAESYARLSGKVGICDAPGGIGSPFVTPALHEANNSSTPLLFLASGVDTKKRGRWTTSQCDQQGLFKSVAKSVYLLDDSRKLVNQLGEALQVAASPRTGPVFFEIPADIFSSSDEVAELSSVPVMYPYFRAEADPVLLKEAKKILYQAKSPVIVVGGGIFLSQAVNELREFQAKTAIPLATTLNGKGVLDETYSNVLGVTGAKGSVEVNTFVQNADCILVLGSKLGDKSTNGYAWPHDKQNVIHVDVDPNVLRRSQRGYLPIRADLRTFIVQMNNLLNVWDAPLVQLPLKKPFWEKGATHHLCQMLSNLLPKDAVLVADASVSSGWAGAAVTFSGSQRLISPRGSGSIGYALPAAIGASFALPESKIIAIGGDGGLAIAMHEMETAARYELPIIYFLLNNVRLGLIDKHATSLLGGKPVSDRFIDMNWCQIANSFGWYAQQINSADELTTLLPGLFLKKQPVLIDYRISPNEIAPDFFIAFNQHREKNK